MITQEVREEGLPVLICWTFFNPAWQESLVAMQGVKGIQKG